MAVINTHKKLIAKKVIERFTLVNFPSIIILSACICSANAWYNCASEPQILISVLVYSSTDAYLFAASLKRMRFYRIAFAWTA